MVVFKKFFVIVIVFFSSQVFTQEIPPIQVFSPQEYNAEDQNWAITQSENGFIYAANNSGLLEYNGASWRLFKSPNEDILRSVNAVSDRIYSGGYMDFGYWVKDERGGFIYTSLLATEEIDIKEDEEFWKIIDIEGYVLFQSLESIYIYNIKEESFSIINSEVRINKMFKVDETIYFQKDKVGLFKIQNGKEVLLTDASIIKDKEIINLYTKDDGLILLTKSDGLFLFNNNLVSKWSVEANVFLSNVKVYSSVELSNGNLLIGTISHGVILVGSSGEILLKIDKSNGLSNNTVLSLTQDKFGNIWLGLDNGINVLNLESPFKVYKDKLGVLGTIYTSAKHNGNIYLGTNQGLFYKSLDANVEYTFIPGTKGQVWFLEILQGSLFCGHDQGTFIIDNNVAKKISDEFGTWIIKEIEGVPNLLIQGNYKGLFILERVGKSWRLRNKIEGFDISSRYIEFIRYNELLVNHELKGVYKIKIDEDFREVERFDQTLIEKGVKSSIVSFEDDIIYSNKKGVFRYSKQDEEFLKDSLLSNVFSGENYYSGKLIKDDESNRLWGFNKDEIVYIEPGNLSNQPKVNDISIPQKIRKNKAGYENILRLEEDVYLIGGTDGYLVLDLKKNRQSPAQIYLNEILYRSFKQDYYSSVDMEEDLLLANKDNSVRFNFSVPEFDKLAGTRYQYRLKGMSEEWSSWVSDAHVSFENLPHGDYTFEARSITGNVVSSNTITYNFSIEKPWSKKPLAIVLYTLIGFLFALTVHYLNRRHYKKQKYKLLKKKEQEIQLEQLENKRKLIQFKNENLQLDIENKNRELGTATMNLVKRNELLNNIKVRLTKIKAIDGLKSVIRLIDDNLNDSSDWVLFEEAFNNVDKDFMKRMKSLHPSITPNDLRLCAYLRLNLSSKEIAPLLNISHKSVEVKRYRLRKKIGLDHDQSLANYILGL
ncbi:MAG: LuxR family transcriptional regulator [Winogradskyella sp.]|uniref:triple tyrosine motif-containing protein n=1 Tax=Winogradskyella sp. TaxID=1883156 RepID=UPI0025F9FDF5|nr:triple tyrosine motif-containing protein [Winogradskyella sp.]NRB60780.1 LuxR family transcriptional regulator [Winogradskyella sp.]